MIDPEYCDGCKYYRPLGWHGSNASRCCHYTADGNKPSRTKLGALENCFVKDTGDSCVDRPQEHKYDTANMRSSGRKYYALYKAGMTDRQIADTLHMNVKVITNWRCRRKLPPNKKTEKVIKNEGA